MFKKAAELPYGRPVTRSRTKHARTTAAQLSTPPEHAPTSGNVRPAAPIKKRSLKRKAPAEELVAISARPHKTKVAKTSGPSPDQIPTRDNTAEQTEVTPVTANDTVEQTVVAPVPAPTFDEDALAAASIRSTNDTREQTEVGSVTAQVADDTGEQTVVTPVPAYEEEAVVPALLQTPNNTREQTEVTPVTAHVSDNTGEQTEVTPVPAHVDSQQPPTTSPQTPPRTEDDLPAPALLSPTTDPLRPSPGGIELVESTLCYHKIHPAFVSWTKDCSCPVCYLEELVEDLSGWQDYFKKRDGWQHIKDLLRANRDSESPITCEKFLDATERWKSTIGDLEVHLADLMEWVAMEEKWEKKYPDSGGLDETLWVENTAKAALQAWESRDFHSKQLLRWQEANAQDLANKEAQEVADDLAQDFDEYVDWDYYLMTGVRLAKPASTASSVITGRVTKRKGRAVNRVRHNSKVYERKDRDIDTLRKAKTFKVMPHKAAFQPRSILRTAPSPEDSSTEISQPSALALYRAQVTATLRDNDSRSRNKTFRRESARVSHRCLYRGENRGFSAGQYKRFEKPNGNATVNTSFYTPREKRKKDDPWRLPNPVEGMEEYNDFLQKEAQEWDELDNQMEID
jgi:hypothetical protein